MFGELVRTHFWLGHAFGQRYELPIPLGLFVAAGAGVVLLSFFLVIGRPAKRIRLPRQTDEIYLRRPGWIPATLSLLILAGLIIAGLAGSQEIPENILPTFFWVIIWVGVALSCGLIGDWTQALNPFANLGKLVDNARLRRLVLARKEPLAWPKRLGWWPAVALFYGTVACELIFNKSMTQPANIALALAAYAAASFLMGLLFGGAWLRKGEFFTVLFNTWGRLGYFRFGNKGRRGFLGGLDVPFAADTSRITFLLLLLASVSFDGLLSTPMWSNLTGRLPSGFGQGSLGYKLSELACLAVVTAFIWCLFTLFAMAVSRAGGHKSTPRQALTGLLPSLLPISFGYLVAHYLQYLMINGQLMFPLLGNPAGSDNWPVHAPYPFNDSYEVHTHIIPTSAAWYIAVAVIIAAHILAVVLAHRHLASRGRTTIAARRSEYPWIAAMVAYTMLSLWLLAQPLIKEKTGSTPAKTASVRQMVTAYENTR